jgi:hypothetical protein
MRIKFFGINKSSVIAGLLIVAVGMLATYLKVTDENLWKVYMLVQQKFGVNYRNRELDEKFRNNEKLLDFLVTTEVDSALEKYNQLPGNEPQVKIPKPIYSEKPVDVTVCYTEACKTLGGEMRLCAPWAKDCPAKDSVLEVN